VSFCYNVGETNFRTSTFLERLNAGDKDGALEALLWWDHPPEIIPRRQGEYVEFRDGMYIARIDPIPPPPTA
jgi:lysozyme